VYCISIRDKAPLLSRPEIDLQGQGVQTVRMQQADVRTAFISPCQALTPHDCMLEPCRVCMAGKHVPSRMVLQRPHCQRF
jgi:hypothetical protein